MILYFCSTYFSLTLFIVTAMHHNTKANSLYVKTHWAINIFLFLNVFAVKVGENVYLLLFSDKKSNCCFSELKQQLSFKHTSGKCVYPINLL